MRLFGDHQNVSLIMQLRSHRHPANPDFPLAETSSRPHVFEPLTAHLWPLLSSSNANNFAPSRAPLPPIFVHAWLFTIASRTSCIRDASQDSCTGAILLYEGNAAGFSNRAACRVKQ
jgi:hypothetical protein